MRDRCVLNLSASDLLVCLATPAHALTVFANVPPTGPTSLVCWSLRRPDGSLIMADVVRLSSVLDVIARFTSGAL